MFLNRRMDKDSVVHLYNGVLLMKFSGCPMVLFTFPVDNMGFALLCLDAHCGAARGTDCMDPLERLLPLGMNQLHDFDLW
ncbi:hypothetical protein STEG23_030517 [Scotinomys teguina]